MQRYFSIGSSTLAALMAAHRETASRHETNHTSFNPAGIAEMERHLDDTAAMLDVEPAPGIRTKEHKAERA
jgi:hypothetical protein